MVKNIQNTAKKKYSSETLQTRTIVITSLSNALHQGTTIWLYIYLYEVLTDSLEVDLDI